MNILSRRNRIALAIIAIAFLISTTPAAAQSGIATTSPAQDSKKALQEKLRDQKGKQGDKQEEKRKDLAERLKERKGERKETTAVLRQRLVGKKKDDLSKNSLRLITMLENHLTRMEENVGEYEKLIVQIKARGRNVEVPEEAVAAAKIALSTAKLDVTGAKTLVESSLSTATTTKETAMDVRDAIKEAHMTLRDAHKVMQKIPSSFRTLRGSKPLPGTNNATSTTATSTATTTTQ